MATVDLRRGTLFDNHVPKDMTARETDIVQDTLQEFNEAQLYRYVFASQWEEAALLIWPEYRNTFMYGNYNWPGQKKTDKQIDANGVIALERFTSIVNSLLTPENYFWHGLGDEDEYLKKQRRVKLWYEHAKRVLFSERYDKVTSGYRGQRVMTWKSLGAFGNYGMFIDTYDDRVFGTGPGLRYRYEPLGGMYIRVNHQNIVDGFIRAVRKTANQILQEFGPENFPTQLVTALNQKSQTTYTVLHRVVPRDDYDSDAIGSKRLRFASYYIFVGGALGTGSEVGAGTAVFIREGGYSTFPLGFGRYTQAPEEIYGRGPAQMVLPALKTLNAEKSIFLKAGHRAGDPVVLTADDGAFDFQNIPGMINKGGVNADGKPLAVNMMPGNIQITKEMMADEAGIIKDMFLVSLFQILTETPQMSATEVIERTNEKGILLAPTVGRQVEPLGTEIHRELDCLSQLGKLPPLPPEIKEARGERRGTMKYRVIYTSPLAKAMRAQEASGFMRSVEWVKEIVAVTQDPSPLDRFDFDVATPDIADINGVPERWMASDDKVALKRKNRAAAQERQAQIQAMPAQAAMIKAQAVAAKGAPQQGGAPGQPLPTAPAFNPGQAPQQ